MGYRKRNRRKYRKALKLAGWKKNARRFYLRRFRQSGKRGKKFGFMQHRKR